MKSLRESESLFFFNDTATTEIYTLSLHDALPIYLRSRGLQQHLGPHVAHRPGAVAGVRERALLVARGLDRKSTRLNSSHANISYAVFCLKKKTPVRGDSLHAHGLPRPTPSGPPAE